MALYAISDLHLAVSIDKPMDIFGIRWVNYMEKLIHQWTNTINDMDDVIIPGDISWATYLEQAVEDFKLIENLPGHKIISKGNHDYWWSTLNKLRNYIKEHNFTSIDFMHNNSFQSGKYIICGTRGWKCPGDKDFTAEDKKIYNRELQRLERSLKNSEENADGKEIIAAMHYPPFNMKGEPSEFVEIMKHYNTSLCIYGHLHGEHLFDSAVTGMTDNIYYILVSADYLNFKPLRIG